MMVSNSTDLPCDGCGQAASAEHIARRLRRLEWATRFRPVHIHTLLLGGVAPREDAEFLYAPGDEFRGEAEFVARRVEKLRVLTRSDAAQQKRMDVHGAKARRPFEPPQPSRDMFGRRRLPAPVARQIRGVR